MKRLSFFLLFVSISVCNVANSATRYYLPISGTAAVSPAIAADWAFNDLASGYRFPLVSAKTNTALTDATDSISKVVDGGEGTGNYFMRQYVSAPIGVQNFNSTTVSSVIRCHQSAVTGTITTTFRANIRLYHTDTTLTTLLTAANFDSAIATTAATRIINATALANVTSQNGDRIIVEIGFNCSVLTGSGANATIIERTGDPSATSDFALTTALTTDLDPWVEFSATIPAQSGGNTSSFFHMFGWMLKPYWVADKFFLTK